MAYLSESTLLLLESERVLELDMFTGMVSVVAGRSREFGCSSGSAKDARFDGMYSEFENYDKIWFF